VKTASKVFLGSAIFSLAIATLYWVVASEPAGTILLASMVLAPGLMASFAALAARGPGRAPEDRPNAPPGAAAGHRMGRFAPESAWPVILALGSLFVAAGLVYGVWLLLPAGGLFALALVGLARESAT
jgi:cytochrome c oxidase subunit IV